MDSKDLLYNIALAAHLKEAGMFGDAVDWAKKKWYGGPHGQMAANPPSGSASTNNAEGKTLGGGNAKAFSSSWGKKVPSKDKNVNSIADTYSSPSGILKHVFGD